MAGEPGDLFVSRQGNAALSGIPRVTTLLRFILRRTQENTGLTCMVVQEGEFVYDRKNWPFCHH